jgi:hypothetical protein
MKDASQDHEHGQRSLKSRVGGASSWPLSCAEAGRPSRPGLHPEPVQMNEEASGTAPVFDCWIVLWWTGSVICVCSLVSTSVLGTPSIELVIWPGLIDLGVDSLVEQRSDVGASQPRAVGGIVGEGGSTQTRVSLPRSRTRLTPRV